MLAPIIREAGGYGWRAEELQDELIEVRRILKEALAENARLRTELAALKGTHHGRTGPKLSALRS